MIHTLYRFYELRWEWESKPLLFVSLLEQPNNSNQEAAAPAGDYQEDAKKLPQIFNLESKLNK